jgi:hypothetical protein
METRGETFWWSAVRHLQAVPLLPLCAVLGVRKTQLQLRTRPFMRPPSSRRPWSSLPPRHPEPERFCRCSKKMKSRYHRTRRGGERRGGGYHGRRVRSTWREDRGPPSPAGCCWLGSAVAASAWSSSLLTPSSGRRRRRRPGRGGVGAGVQIARRRQLGVRLAAVGGGHWIGSGAKWRDLRGNENGSEVLLGLGSAWTAQMDDPWGSFASTLFRTIDRNKLFFI